MKTIRRIFTTQKTKKTMSSFLEQLDFKKMIIVRGGEGDPDNPDVWSPPPPPPPTTT